MQTATEAINYKKAKDLLKAWHTFLTSKETSKLTNNNTALKELVDALVDFTAALKDTYSPNIFRFMTGRDAYIKELVSSAKNVQETTIPAAIKSADALTVADNETPFVSQLVDYLRAFQAKNKEIQARVSQHKGDMVENTTHDIMQKYLQKNYEDIGELVTPVIDALDKK